MRISDWSSDVCSSDLPGLQRFPAGAFRLVAENVRMAADHLGGDRRHDVVNAEGATLLGDAGVVDDLKLEVAKLFLQVGHIAAADGIGRSEERRVGEECVSTCRSRGSPYH